MADSAVAITAGTGTNIDTRTAPDGNHRQVMVLGDPDLANEAHVTDPALITGALTTGSQGAALNVNPNAIQKATYYVTMFATATGVLTASTTKLMASLDHAAGSTKTVRLRRVIATAMQTTALAGVDSFILSRYTGVATAGTAYTPGPALPGSAAAEVTARTGTAVATPAQTILLGYTGSVTAATANTGFGGVLVYDWQESGETIPFTLRAGVAEGLGFGFQASAAKNFTVSLTLVFTEE